MGARSGTAGSAGTGIVYSAPKPPVAQKGRLDPHQGHPARPHGDRVVKASSDVAPSLSIGKTSSLKL